MLLQQEGTASFGVSLIAQGMRCCVRSWPGYVTHDISANAVQPCKGVSLTCWYCMWLHMLIHDLFHFQARIMHASLPPSLLTSPQSGCWDTCSMPKNSSMFWFYGTLLMGCTSLNRPCSSERKLRACSESRTYRRVFAGVVVDLTLNHVCRNALIPNPRRQAPSPRYCSTLFWSWHTITALRTMLTSLTSLETRWAWHGTRVLIGPGPQIVWCHKHSNVSQLSLLSRHVLFLVSSISFLACMLLIVLFFAQESFVLVQKQLLSCAQRPSPRCNVHSYTYDHFHP